MVDKDYFLYDATDDILVVYSFEDDTLREDTFYGFEYGTQDINKDIYFWKVNWDSMDTIRHKFLLSDYTIQEFEEKIVKNEYFFSFDYQEQYTVQDVLEVIYENEFNQFE